MRVSANGKQPRALLTDGQERSILSACRTLGAAGYACDVVATERPAPAQWSRHSAGRFRATDPRIDPRRFIAGVERIVAAGRYDVLLPGSDATLLALARHGSRLCARIQTGLPPRVAIERSLSKIALLEAAEKAGQPAPEAVVCDTSEAAVTAARGFGFPVVLKPRSSVLEYGRQLRQHASRTVWDEEALADLVADFGTPCIVQRREPGHVVSVGGVLVEGELVAAVASRYARTWHPDAGSASSSESIRLTADLRHAVSEIVRALGWQGIFELELLERSDGKLLPIDFNPRVYGSLALSDAAGVPLVTIWCDWLRGGLTRRGFAEPGHRYRWLDADLRSIAWLASHGKVRRALTAAYPRPHTTHAFGSLSDPLPTGARVGLMARHATAKRNGRKDGIRVAVIGAGPYGLSAASFCRRAGAEVVAFGRPMDFWRQGMPAGMLLRSRWRSSHIADPSRSLSLDSYERVIGRALPNHIALADFIDYGRWYQDTAVPDLDERLVRRVSRGADRFKLALDDGGETEADAVIVATGLYPFAHRPRAFERLPATLCTHAMDLREPSALHGKDVLVVGAGQSALESAALLVESGASVEVVARAATLEFLDPEDDLGLVARANAAIAPPTDVGGRLSGWLVAAPDAYRQLPQETRVRLAQRAVRPRGADWLRPRLDAVRLTLGTRVTGVQADDNMVRATLSDGTERRVAHVVLGTGYRIDVGAYEFLADDVIGALRLREGSPVLGPGLESSVPGLHFVGAVAAESFGPIMRFVVGTWYAGPAVAEGIARARRRPVRLSYRRRGPGQQRRAQLVPAL